MARSFLAFLACLGISPAAYGAEPQLTRPAPPFVHPGMLQSRWDLEFMKQKVLAGEQPWKDAWDRLCHMPYSSLDFHPSPFAHVIRGAYGRPSIGSNELMASADAAYSHAIQWYVTGEKAHAAKAIEILNAWSPVLVDFASNDAKLLAGWTGHQFLNAAEILRYSESGWQLKDIEQFKRMILGVYYPLIKNFFPEANGNWDAAIMHTMLCIGVFCDDRAIFDRAVDHYLGGRVNGGIMHYVYSSGQCEESTRDQDHTQLGLGEMAQACQVAWTQGIDLFGAADNRLALGFEYTAKYLLGGNAPCDGTISPKGRGRFRDIYQLVYDHYRFQKGIEMPFTERAARQTLPRSISVLTMYRGPRARVAATTVGPPKPSLVAALAGATSEPSAKPPANAVFVAPGQSIQKALDARKGSGGCIVLAAGLHKLPAALLLPSGVTLAGQGEKTLLWLDPIESGPAVVNASADFHDVTLRDLVIEGATAGQPHSDPNADRRARARTGALSRAGIILVAPTTAMRNIRLEHVTVRHCTLSGVTITGATGAVIADCSFTDNGASFGHESESLGNLSLTRVSKCQVTDNRLDDSLSGAGLDLGNCDDITVTSNEIARNALTGIRTSNCSGLKTRGNLLEGNDDQSLHASKSR